MIRPPARVPIVCAAINDFRDMATDEDMAVRFYEIGNAEDLAQQLITVLESPELQRSMGRQNFAAGLEMTIARVVSNYLRWFELNKYKRELLAAGSSSAVPALRATQAAGLANGHSRDGGASAQPDLADPLA